MKRKIPQHKSQAPLSFTISWSLLKFISMESVMPSNHLILCWPLLLLPSIFPNIRVFSNELALCIRWLNIGASASASVLPMIIQGWFPLGLTGLISLLSKGLLSIFSSTTIQKHQFSSTHPSFSSVQFISVTQLCLTLYYPMDYSMPGFPVHHQFTKLAQTHVHRVGDAFQPSHPLSSPSPPALNLFPHQGLFQ